jgi:hypothetical protein
MVSGGMAVRDWCWKTRFCFLLARIETPLRMVNIIHNAFCSDITSVGVL